MINELEMIDSLALDEINRITSYNVCYTKLLRLPGASGNPGSRFVRILPVLPGKDRKMPAQP